jgi:hypothetical protein
MTHTEASPPWLWRLASRGLVVCTLGVLALAAALALGFADPPRAGPLLWQDDFKDGTQRWTLSPPASGTLEAADGALAAVFAESSSSAAAITTGLTRAPQGDYTLEVAGAAVTGTPAYGLVFDWQDDLHYSAVYVNGDGYAEAYYQVGGNRQTLYEWQQWPHVLFGTDANRVRVDVRGQAVTLRINGEVLGAWPRAAARGQVGLAARSRAAARVVFSWAKVWASS